MSTNRTKKKGRKAEKKISLLSNRSSSREALRMKAERANGELKRLSLLERMMRRSEEAILTFDAHGRVTTWDRVAEKIYGYKAEEVLGKTLRQTVPKLSRQEWKERMNRVLVRGESFENLPLERIRKDGKHVWILTTTIPMKNSDGKIVGAASLIRDITQEMSLRVRLEHSERMYRELFEDSRDIIFISSRDGEIIDINPAGVAAFGYKNKEEMMRLDIARDLYLDPAERRKLQEKIAHNGYAADYELRLKRKNGEIMIALETSTPIRDEKGEIVAYRGILRDVTEKKRLEDLARESERKYRSLVEHSPDGVAVTRGGKFLYTNQVLASIYGYTNEKELIGLPIHTIVGEEHKEGVTNWFVRQEEGRGTSGRLEFRGLRKDGKNIDVEVHVALIPFEGQTSLISFHRDVTSRRQLHEELGEAERIVGEILATMGDALVITDLNGKVLQVNREFETMTGYTRSEAFGVEFPYPWLLEEEMSRFVLWISELRAKNFLHDFDMNWKTKDGKKLAVSLNTTLLRNTRGEPIAMLNIARDISERKRLQEELEARSKQIEILYQETLSKSLEIERRNKELDDFTYVVSHDLKEPLVTIEGYGKILENDFKKELGSTGLEYLNSVITAANRMKRFIDDLLALTRLSRITEAFRPTSFATLLEEIQRDLEFTFRERKVRFAVDTPMPVIMCNGSQMKLVFQNLISNAIKFNDKLQPEVSVGYEELPAEHRFYVRDNGIGIEEQYHEKIFGIFQRLHRAEEYTGTGVGLTIVKKIVDLHEGRIWVESKVGEGTTFYFTIPKRP